LFLVNHTGQNSRYIVATGDKWGFIEISFKNFDPKLQKEAM
jgi:hypothetical protein